MSSAEGETVVSTRIEPGTGLRLSPRSFWLEEAQAADPGTPCPPLQGSVKADVCVVGGGFAGLWTAYELGEREPSLDVVLIEADICGSGGSGANGGFASSSWHDIMGICAICGESEGLRYATALADQITEIDQWRLRHGADIELHPEGVAFVRAGEWEPEPDAASVDFLASRGMADRLRIMSADEVRAIADSPRFLGGTFIKDVATVQPAKLARELRRVLLERGVRIFESTPMTGLCAGTPVHVHTAGGAVHCDQAVVTTGAWASSAPPFRNAFVVCIDSVVITEPVPDLLEEIGWTSNVGFADDRESFFYLRRTDEGRVAIGGGSMGIAYGDHIDGRAGEPTSRAMTSPDGAAIASEGLLWLFPQLRGVRFTHAWTGPMDMTASLLPFFMSSPGGTVHVGLGFSGHGLTATKVGGKTLTSMVLRADDEWASLPVVGPPLSAVPPEPLRWPAIKFLASTVEASDLSQQRGGSGSPLARLGAGFFTRFRGGLRTATASRRPLE